MVINNAGVMHNGYFDLVSADKIVQTLDVDVAHVALMTSAFLPVLQARKQKTALINVSSTIGYMEGTCASAVYCASKSYVNYLT